MLTMRQIVRRDFFDNDGFSGPPPLVIIGFLVVVCCSVAAFMLVRHRRRAALRAATLPMHYNRGHHRTLTITTHPSNTEGGSICIYDEKMNLIANSSAAGHSSVPEIHVTFPDDEVKHGEAPKAGRVVVLKISDSGSVGMEPLHTDNLPPYQKSDEERFHSLDIERLGGLREKDTGVGQRWS